MQPSRATLVGLLVLLLAALPSRGQELGAPREYIIGPKDTLKVQVLEDSTLNIDEARVSDSGTIELLHVGEVAVAGRTASGAAEAISAALERFLQRATVTVQISDFRSQPIMIIGAVSKPGRLPFSGRWTLLEALTEAGGLTKDAGDTIFIRRQAPNGLVDELEIAVADLMTRMDPSANVTVFANDLINVPPAYEVVVYCNGEVSTRGRQTFRSTELITVVTAISRAGGLSENASGKVIVKRAENQFVLNYDRILKGDDPDFPLEHNDVIIAKESFF